MMMMILIVMMMTPLCDVICQWLLMVMMMINDFEGIYFIWSSSLLFYLIKYLFMKYVD